MSDIALANAAAYARLHRLVLLERLGFGIHGTVHVAQHESKYDQSAIKAFGELEFYCRELAFEGMGIYLLDVSPSNIGFAR